MDKNDVIVINTPDGGGYGNLAERDPNLVLEDVMDGKISMESAYRKYLVKIVRRENGELTIDFDETEKLRKFRNRVR